MAKLNNQKGKILYLAKILRETGDDRAVSMQEILAELGEYGITAERKSIYDDIEVLRSFGMEIKFRRGKTGGYYLAGQMAAERQETAQESPVKDAEPETVVPENHWNLRAEKAKEGTKQIKLLCENARRQEVEAYFGDTAQYKEKTQGYFTASVQVAENPQFYGWLTAMGSSVFVLKPKKAAQAYREYLKSLAKEYKGI